MVKLVKLVYRDVLEDMYFANNDGHIYMKHPNGEIVPVSEFLDAAGYPQVRLISKTKYTKQYPVHRLICSAFHGGDHPDMVPDHLNATPTDNTPGNLEWVTHQENARRGVYTRRSATLTVGQIVKVCEMLQDGKTIPEIEDIISEEAGISDGRYYNAIYNIAKRKVYTGISYMYNWDAKHATMKVYSEEHIKTLAMIVVHHRDSFTLPEIAKMFPSYEPKKLKAVVKKMRQGKLYKEYLAWAESQDPGMTLRDEEGFMILAPVDPINIIIADMKLAAGKVPPSRRKYSMPKHRKDWRYTKESYKRKTYYERLNQENEKDE